MRHLSLVLLLAACGDAPAPAEPEAELAARFAAHVELLASDAYLGRGTGEEGTKLAADYAAKHFAEHGLVPVDGREDYFAPVTFYAADWDASTAVTVTGEGAPSLELGKSFAPFDFSDEGEAEAELVFAGYGIRAPEFEWDDYEGLDVEGKIVVLLRHEPREKDETWDKFAGAQTTDHAAFLAKARAASEAGAVGMILATDPLHHEAGDDFRGRRRLMIESPDSVERGPSEGPLFLAVHASQAAVDALVASTGKSLKEIQEALDAGSPAKDFAIDGLRAKLVVDAAEQAVEVTDRNVVAMVPGTDPARKDELIVIGAHYDHLGAYEGEGDTIYNGADDNASGTAGVLELARHFAAHPVERTLVFALFTGEEKGLLGSKVFVRDETVDIDKVAFMLNLDMISRNGDEPVEVLGEAYAAGLQPIVAEAAAEAGLEVTFGGTDYAGNSDHDSFYRAHVPFMFFFSGLHDDYHQLSDHADTVDVDRAVDVIEASRGVIERLAALEAPLPFVHHLTWMGVSLEAEGEGAVLTSVDPSSRAKEAGLERGDLIRGVNGEALAPEAVGEALAEAEPGSLVTLEIKRGVEVREVELTRAKTGYLGVFPGGVEDEVKEEHGLLEGEGLLLRQVVDDGPAFAGGLRAGDVVYRINGMPTDLRSLSARLARIGAGEQISVDILREGERQTLLVTLGERPER